MADGDRWLVVGLGNPEGEYGGTRHNVGADVVRVLAARLGANLTPNKRVRCETADVRVGGARATLAVPRAYMNESGGPVQAAVRWLGVPLERLVVVHDELDLDVGVLRLKAGGGHAGHNGLRDLDRALPDRDYLRVRVGVGRPVGRTPPRKHLLSRFTPAQRERIDVMIEHAADAVESLIADGLEPTQNRYHQPQAEPRT